MFQRLTFSILQGLAFVGLTTAQSFAEYILAPADRAVAAESVYESRGTVTNAQALCAPGAGGDGTTFLAVNSSVTVDFGKNIAGSVQFEVLNVTGTDEFVGFTFTESSMWISPEHCDSGTTALYDSPLWFSIPSTGQYAASKERQRGGFRYMTVVHNSTGSITISNLSVNFTAAPEMEDMRAYAGYFNSDSEKLNRVWYAGAYTNQLCSMDPGYGNALNVPGTNWAYNQSVGSGTSVLIDGAKRDRLVWPGDIAISGPSIFVSTNSLDSIRNGIDSLFGLQAADGRLPWAGIGWTTATRFSFSFTYHLYTLLDLYYYVTFTGDTDYLDQYWNQYKLALNWSLATIDDTKLANVSSRNDWLRSGMGGHNVEANAIFYHTMDMTLRLINITGDDSFVDTITTAMDGIKTAVNERLWDPSTNLFFDNDQNQTPTAVRPQDGNSWAIVAGLLSPSRAALVSTSLMQRWVRPYGAPAPEAGATISPFASGFEVQAHYLAGFPQRSIDLIEFMWSDFMLDDPRMTNSSFIEGYATNGNLHYAPYSNDARVSHAHGWATGPTSALTFFGAGLQLVGLAGETWLIQPRLGGLGRISAGFVTPLGDFSASWIGPKDGTVASGNFSTPEGTSGTLILPLGGGSDGILVVTGPDGVVSSDSIDGTELTFSDLPGGTYVVSST